MALPRAQSRVLHTCLYELGSTSEIPTGPAARVSHTYRPCLPPSLWCQAWCPTMCPARTSQHERVHTRCEESRREGHGGRWIWGTRGDLEWWPKGGLGQEREGCVCKLSQRWVIDYWKKNKGKAEAD